MYQGGFLIARLNKVGNRIFERVLSEQNIEAFNGAQGRILYVLWQKDRIPIREIADKTGLAVTSLTSMLDRMETAASEIAQKIKIVFKGNRQVIHN